MPHLDFHEIEIYIIFTVPKKIIDTRILDTFLLEIPNKFVIGIYKII